MTRARRPANVAASVRARLLELSLNRLRYLTSFRSRRSNRVGLIIHNSARPPLVARADNRPRAPRPSTRPEGPECRPARPGFLVGAVRG